MIKGLPGNSWRIGKAEAVQSCAVRRRRPRIDGLSESNQNDGNEAFRASS